GGCFPQRFVRAGAVVWEPTFEQFPPPHGVICGLQDLTHGVQLRCHFGVSP
ncbi:hypothetical protein N336_04925, partial [Phalacrocorax carbo]